MTKAQQAGATKAQQAGATPMSDSATVYTFDGKEPGAFLHNVQKPGQGLWSHHVAVGSVYGGHGVVLAEDHRDVVSALQARVRALEADTESASAFLETIDWNDTTSEYGAAVVQHAVELALKFLTCAARTHLEKDTR